jgi:diguanylate cyclase (GGDEF)-like protein
VDPRDPQRVGDVTRSGVTARLFTAVGAYHRSTVTLCSLVLVGVIALVDAQLEPMVALTVLYLVPVFVTASRDAAAGLLLAVVAVTAGTVVDVVRPDSVFDGIRLPLVNSLMRLLVFLLVVRLVVELRRQQRHEAELARVDHLTGLLNRRGFADLAEQARQQHVRNGRPLTLAYLDVDGMKSVNDRYGHAVGDEVIARVGGVLARGVRAADVPCRLHGDEFAVLLPDTGVEQACAVLDRVHEQLTTATSSTPGVGYSIGAVTFHDDVESVETTLAAADAVMYEVKSSGRGAVRCLPDRAA